MLRKAPRIDDVRGLERIERRHRGQKERADRQHLEVRAGKPPEDISATATEVAYKSR